MDSILPISEYFRDFALEVSYLESTEDLTNREKPLIRNIGSLQYRFHAKQHYYSTNRLSQIEVTTTVGGKAASAEIVSGLFWQTVMTNNQERDPKDEVLYLYNLEYLGPEKKPYAVIHFELSNQVKQIRRNYHTI